MQIIETISRASEVEFFQLINARLKDGFKVSSSSCGYVPNPYDCEYWMAILVKEVDDNKIQGGK